MCLKVLNAYAHSLLQVKRSRVGLTRGSAKKLEVGFASGQPENSSQRKASPKSLEDHSEILQKVTSKKKSFQFHVHGRISCQISKAVSA